MQDEKSQRSDSLMTLHGGQHIVCLVRSIGHIIRDYKCNSLQASSCNYNKGEGLQYTMANPNLHSQHKHSILTDENFMKRYKEIDSAIHTNNLAYLLSEKTATGNLSKDPLLTIVIAYDKSDLAIHLISNMSKESLMAHNHDGDTALHFAAARGNVKVAMALVNKNQELINARNKNNEIPLHKAAIFGQTMMFWVLVSEGSSVYAKREDGACVLHCAIMGNAPDLALQIAKEYPDMMMKRNEESVTPFQLLVTIPEAFRSQLRLGSIESIIYDLIPLEEVCHESARHDVESVKDEGLLFLHKQRKRFPSNYSTLFDLLQIACIPVRWVRLLTFNIIKQLSSRIRYLHYQKQKHKQTMDLIDYLAVDLGYWDFIGKGKEPEQKREVPVVKPIVSMNHGHEDDALANSILDNNYKNPSKETTGHDPPPTMDKKKSRWDDSPLTLGTKMGLHEFVERILNVCPQSAGHDPPPTMDKKKSRWDDSPLTLGAKMGLHEFVERILNVCPQSAAYLDAEGLNVLQVAIKYGQEKIVDIIDSMTAGNNPVLPSWLLSSTDVKTKNTILHFAAKKERLEDEGLALQMQFELQWFERVKKLLPKDLEYSRDSNEKTAQELFTETHKDMVKSGRTQLMEVGKTCSSLVAAVVFASSFSIPGDKDSKGNPSFKHKLAFQVFSHAYVLGLSFAATALVLFLSLITSSYKELDFRRALPTKYILANLSFFLALIALLVAFTCNIYLSIYGAAKAETSDLVPMICELTIFPTVCFSLLLYRSSSFGIGTYFRRVIS